MARQYVKVRGVGGGRAGTRKPKCVLLRYKDVDTRNICTKSL